MTWGPFGRSSEAKIQVRMSASPVATGGIATKVSVELFRIICANELLRPMNKKAGSQRASRAEFHFADGDGNSIKAILRLSVQKPSSATSLAIRMPPLGTIP